jgi:outer membrane protein TolC
VVLALGSPLARAAEVLTLEQALSRAYASNPEIAASQADAKSERAMVKSKYFLSDPKVGLMREVGMNFMEQTMGPMNTWSFSQEVLFPPKYFLMGSAQSARADAASREASQKALNVREKVISAYYKLFSVERTLALFEAQRETLREVARIAESRHATGNVPQQDEMKAHVEQTQIENEIIVAEEEKASTEAFLNQLLDQDASASIQFPKEELPIPDLKISLDQISKIAQSESNEIQASQALVTEADKKKSLANLSYAPDFMLSYRKAFTSADSNNYAASIEFTIPLWFFARQTSEVSAAGAARLAAEKRLELSRRSVDASVRSLSAKVRSERKILEIYKTALIPQASTTLSSSRSAYQAGRTSFVDLLDSERSLYSVRINYYRTLADYAGNLAQLEAMVGRVVSELPGARAGE